MSSETSEEITIQRWVKRGSLMVNAEALKYSDPDHIYNQVLAQGKRPEDYGIFHPYEAEFKGKSRNELIEEIVSLREEIESLYRSSAMWA